MDYFCAWVRNDDSGGCWIPDCRQKSEWTFADEDGPEEAGMKFCPICGCPVHVVEKITGGNEE